MKGNTANKYNLVDSHAHLDFSNFNGDREEVIQRAKRAGVQLILNVGFDLDTSKKSIALAETYPFVFAAVGIPPHDASRAPSLYLEELARMADHPRVVALGEMGLDFYRDRSPRKLQREVFRQQLQLAREKNLPVIIHDREAHQEVMQILQTDGLPAPGGIMHCFSGDLALAKWSLRLGLYISIAGPVTYPKNAALGQVAANVPLDRLLIETDAPFLTPVPRRGKRNEPAYVALVAEKIAALRGTTPDNIGQACLDNARRLFQVEAGPRA